MASIDTGDARPVEVLPRQSGSAPVEHQGRVPPKRNLAAQVRRALLLGGVLALGALAAARFGPAAAPADRILGPDEAARRAARLADAGPIEVPIVAGRQIAAALAALNLPAAEREQLAKDVEAGRLRLVWLSLYDTDAEDGDVVTIGSAGFLYTLGLAKAPAAVAVPVAIGGPVTLTGTRDGGGGVTVGVVGPQGPLPVPPLSVGQTISLAVAPR